MSWINDGLPERRISPRPKYASIPHCPHCGSDEIGVIEECLVFSSVMSWDDGEPDELNEEDREYTGYHDPKFYCLYCGEDFKTPDMRRVEVI